MCNCEYCVKCDRCGHKADEHIAGEGHCFLCKCPIFQSCAVDAWDNLKLIEQQKYPSFEEFMNKWVIDNE